MTSRGVSDARIYGGIALLVIGLAVVVWRSLPGDTTSVTTSDAAPEDAGEEAAAVATEGIPRPMEATANFVVLIDKPEAAVRALATVPEISARLAARHCGAGCDAVKKVLADHDSFELDVLTGEDLILPDQEMMDTVGVGLTPAERASVHKRPMAVAIRVDGALTQEQLAARAGFAAAAVIAEATDGLVWDETCRRIDASRDFAKRAITSKLDEPAFARQHIVVQLYRDPDGPAHLRTLGMVRFGSPDLSIRDANMASGPQLAEVINAAAAKIAAGTNETSLTITPDDIAKLTGTKPGGTKPVQLDVTTPERTEGDADNALAELVPKDGKGREAWDAIVIALFGEAPSASAPADDKELAAIATKARASLPGAIKRFEAGEGELYVKGPFAIAQEARTEDGAASELLWVSASSCDAMRCTGVLSNEPSYATNLAAGKVTSVARSDVADWLLKRRDGRSEGGESIKVLKTRQKH
jgi:uncharacterized protein YegJ (DUF2314 family)